jgi:hypothetical protein
MCLPFTACLEDSDHRKRDEFTALSGLRGMDRSVHASPHANPDQARMLMILSQSVECW